MVQATLFQGPVAEATSITIAPRYYQTDAIKAVDDDIAAGFRRTLVAMATGSGKTIVFAMIIAQRHQQYHGRAVVLVHRDELAQQALEKLAMVNPTASLGLVKAEDDHLWAETVVASVQTLARPNRMQRFLTAINKTGGIHTIVLDEAHHSEANSFNQVLGQLGAFDGHHQNLITLGFTATPERADGKALGATWEKISYSKDMISLIKEGYLCDVRGLTVKLDTLDLAHVKKTGGDYADGALGEALENADAPEHVLESYLEHGENRKFIGFTPTVRLAEEMAEVFRNAGVNATAISAKTSKDERRDAIKKLASGQVQGIFNAAVLTEGFDEPSIQCIILARPTRSHGTYIQMVGRGTRLYPGKKDLLVLDVVGASDTNRLVMVASLAGKIAGASGSTLKLKPGQSILEAVAEEEKEKKKDEQRLGRLVAQKTNLFDDVGVKAAAPVGRSDINWMTLHDGFFCLPAQGQSLLVWKDAAERWIVTIRHGAGDGATQEDLWLGTDLGYAQGYAEDFARRSASEWLITREAKWRSEPATSKQIWALRKNGHRASSMAMTKGEAADALTVIKEREAWGL